MINSLCGSMGTLKTESSCNKLQQTTSPNKPSSDQRKLPPSSDFESNSLIPSSLDIHGLKFEVEGDEEHVQSPDSSMWESFFSDHFDSDFMMASPVRSSPMNYTYNYVQSMQGQSLLGCSPPRSSSQVGSFSSSHKGKGQSPLHKVFNSPTYQYIQPDTLSLPPLESLLDDYQRDGVGASSSFSMMKLPAVGISGALSLAQYLDMPMTVHPSALDLQIQNPSRFCGSVSANSTTGSSQLTQEKDNIYQMGSMSNSAPLSLQLQQEHRQEQQQMQEHQNINRSLMVPHPLGSEQVFFVPKT